MRTKMRSRTQAVPFGPLSECRRRWEAAPRCDSKGLDGAGSHLRYDVVNDFEPIALLANNPVLILAKNAVPANDVTGLIAWLKANPDKALFGTASVGSPLHSLAAFLP